MGKMVGAGALRALSRLRRGRSGKAEDPAALALPLGPPKPRESARAITCKPNFDPDAALAGCFEAAEPGSPTGRHVVLHVEEREDSRVVVAYCLREAGIPASGAMPECFAPLGGEPRHGFPIFRIIIGTSLTEPAWIASLGVLRECIARWRTRMPVAFGDRVLPVLDAEAS